MVPAVIYFSVTPVAIETGVDQCDRISHMLAYTTLLLWFSNIYPKPHQCWWFAASFVVMGIALEFVQGWTSYRHFEGADNVGDAAGVAIRLGARAAAVAEYSAVYREAIFVVSHPHLTHAGRSGMILEGKPRGLDA